MAKNDEKTGFLSQGSKVEVAIDGAWFEAHVLTECADSNDQFRVASPDMRSWDPKQRSVNKWSIRPRPPPPSADPSYEPRDVVDVLNCNGWWKGVVSGVYTLKGQTSYTVVLFENPPYYDDRMYTSKELRFHWVWTRDGRWVRPPKPKEIPGLGEESPTSNPPAPETMAANENQIGFLSQGSPVEVKYKGAWYKANILKKCLKSKDQFSVSCRGKYSEVNVLNINISSIRPRPPPPTADQSYEPHDVVDVVHFNGWWKGVVSGVYMLNGQTSYTVALFEYPPYSGLEDKIFTSEEMRFHWVWTRDGQWVRPPKGNEEFQETPKAMKSTCDLGGNLPAKGKNPVSTCHEADIVPLDQQETGLKTRDAKSSKKRPRELKSYIPNQKALAAGNTDDDSAKVTKKGNFDQSSEVNAQAGSEIARKEDPPFRKRSYLWKEIDSLEVFRVLPQNPHFAPLMDCNEDTREGMAMGHMWNFASLVEKVSKLKIEDPKSLFERYLEALAVLETVGFDVKAVVDRVNELLAFKTKQEQLAFELSSLKDTFNVKSGASW